MTMRAFRTTDIMFLNLFHQLNTSLRFVSVHMSNDMFCFVVQNIVSHVGRQFLLYFLHRRCLTNCVFETASPIRGQSCLSKVQRSDVRIHVVESDPPVRCLFVLRIVFTCWM